MRIAKVHSCNRRYPLRVKMDDGRYFLVPQQREFGDFCRRHGCSVAAVTVALQNIGILRDPDDVHTRARKILGGYTGSKLTIFGCEGIINALAGTRIATWHPITGTAANRKKSIRMIRNALKRDCIVLVEQRSPIHTNAIIARRNGGVWVATNGKLKKATVAGLVRQALRGRSRRSEQRNWFRGSEHGAGFVIVEERGRKA